VKKYLVTLLTILIMMTTYVGAYRVNIINGTVFIIDNNNDIIGEYPVTVFLGKNETFYSNINKFNNFNLYHLYISQTPLPRNYYTILMNTISPNPYYHQDLINALNLMMSGNVTTYYLYTVSLDYSKVIGIELNVNNTMPNINEVRLKVIDINYDIVNRLGIVVRWLHVKKISTRYLEKNYIISSLVTDGNELIKFLNLKTPSVHVYKISDIDFYYLQDPIIASSTEVNSFADILPYLESGEVVYLYYNINPDESVYVEVVPVRILNDDIYNILKEYGNLANISVWGYAFYGDSNSDGSDGYDVTEASIDNVFHGSWLDLLIDYVTFDAYMNLTSEQFRTVQVSLYSNWFGLKPDIGNIINWTYENGTIYFAIYKRLSDGTYFTLKYALSYYPNYSYKALRVRDYNATTENDAFLQDDLIFTPYSYAPILYYNRDLVDRIDIYNTNGDLVMTIDGVTLRSPYVDINVIESFLENSFYDNSNYSKMIIYYMTSPASMTIITKEMPSLTNTYYRVESEFYQYNWTFINFIFWNTYDFDSYVYYGRVSLGDVIDEVTPAFVPISPRAVPAEFLASINYTTFENYKDPDDVSDPYYSKIGVMYGYTLSAYLQKLNRILMNNYNVGFYTYYLLYNRGFFSGTLVEYFTYPYIDIVKLNESSTDISIVTKNIYVPFYGVTQMTLHNLLTYNITIDNITLYVNNVDCSELIIGNYSGVVIPARSFVNINIDGFGMMAYSNPELTLDSFFRTRIIDPLNIRLIIKGRDPFEQEIELAVSARIVLIYVV